MRGFVPQTGLEPVRPRRHRILSPACLPIPPPGHFGLKTNSRVSFRAKDGSRTRDLNLGKVTLYQLSYFRL